MASLSLPLPDPRSTWIQALLTDAPTRRPLAPKTQEAEESLWIRRAQGGDPAAFKLLVDRYRHLALEVALRIVRSPEEAEEAAQDAFIKAWRALDGFRREARFSTWLYRIVTRCALDAVRRVQRRGKRETGWEPKVMEAVPAATPTPGRDLLRLERVLGELTPVSRAVVTLFYLRDQTVEEIGSILDLPGGTVKTHLHRSRAALRKAWFRHEENDGLRGI